MFPETLLNVQEVAEFLRVNATTVYTWARQGQLPAIKIGRRWRFRQSDLEMWLDQNRQDAQAGDHALSDSET
ncbi:MAG: helix-turn-helix domain-containing protein [Anaerolineae bacterium]|jgi:excisionase family DNA binding protein|nr:helix-turn-helix domain-containing protein [Anaerolineae bacterium]MDH7474074.1 helix-turn-helix domain-containing protein [Anaerolineae bacterium]